MFDGSEPYCKTAVLDLRDVLKLVHSQLSYKDLFLNAGLVDNEAAADAMVYPHSRFMNHAHEGNKWQTLKEPEFYKITKYLVSSQKWKSLIEDHFGNSVFEAWAFHGFAGWFRMKPADHEELRSHFCGSTWVIYRPSLTNRRYVFVGGGIIKYRPESRCISVDEEYLTDASDEAVSHASALSGFMIKEREGAYCIMSRDLNTGESQHIKIRNISYGRGRDGQQCVTCMSGVLLDSHNRVTEYGTRIAFLRGNEVPGMESGGMPSIPARPALRTVLFDQLNDSLKELIASPISVYEQRIVEF